MTEREMLFHALDVADGIEQDRLKALRQLVKYAPPHVVKRIALDCIRSLEGRLKIDKLDRQMRKQIEAPVKHPALLSRGSGAVN